MKTPFIYIIIIMIFFQSCKYKKDEDITIVNIQVGRLKMQIPSILNHSSTVEYSDYNSNIDGYEEYQFKTGKDTGSIVIQTQIKGKSDSFPSDSILFQKMKLQMKAEHRQAKIIKTEIKTISKGKLCILYYNSGFYVRVLFNEDPYRITLKNVSDIKLQNQIIQSIQKKSP